MKSQQTQPARKQDNINSNILIDKYSNRLLIVDEPRMVREIAFEACEEMNLPIEYGESILGAAKRFEELDAEVSSFLGSCLERMKAIRAADPNQ